MIFLSDLERNLYSTVLGKVYFISPFRWHIKIYCCLPTDHKQYVFDISIKIILGNFTKEYSSIITLLGFKKYPALGLFCWVENLMNLFAGALFLDI